MKGSEDHTTHNNGTQQAEKDDCENHRFASTKIAAAVEIRNAGER